jgi:flagellar basal body-associated protein FliL
MLKKIFPIIMAAIMMVSIVGCYAQTFVVGNGAQQSQTQETRQWYILFGLVPLNTVDTHSMAGATTDYTIHTEQTFLDVVMNIFTSAVTVYSRTVTVTK